MKLRLISLLTLAALLAGSLSGCGLAREPAHTHQWEQVSVAATCTQDGYTQEECVQCHETRNTQTIPATGHTCSHWRTVTQATLLEGGEEEGVCLNCGETMLRDVPSLTYDIPKVYLEGDLDSVNGDDRTPFSLTYESPLLSYECYATLTVQGGSSAFYDYSKLNYNIRLYKDKDHTDKYKVDVGWGRESKYCLKANFVDSTSARNIVSARLWGNMVRTRADVPQVLLDAPNAGAVDGFPVMLFVNGELYGLYTWNIPKDEWMFNIHGDDTGAVLFASNWKDACRFKALSACDDSEWELKYESDDLSGKTYERLNEIISFVMNSSDEEFEEHIDEYVDVNSVIDYIILIYLIMAGDNTSKNMLMVTYDGLKFYASAYDLDATWSLHWTGQKFDTSTGDMIRADSTGSYLRTGDNLLFDRILKFASEEFADRYFELRATILSKENIMDQFENFTDRIPQELYEADWTLHPDVPSTATNTLPRIEAFIDERFAVLDEVIRPFATQSN